MGAGKSAVGRELARRTGLPRWDTDELIRAKFGASIAEIFADHGETMFRDAETAVIGSLAGDAIVVTGGGVILREENVRRLREFGRTVWLDADEETLWRRASLRGTRPLLETADPRARFTALLRERLPLYAAAADDRIDTAPRSLAEVADEILAYAHS